MHTTPHHFRTLALSAEQGSSTQIALFVVPVMVLLGWAAALPLNPMTHEHEPVARSPTTTRPQPYQYMPAAPGGP